MRRLGSVAMVLVAMGIAPAPVHADPPPLAKPAPKLEVPKKPLDLTPSHLFDLGSPLATSQPTQERGPGLTLGNDRNWKVQAAQVGAMVGIFAGLAALCGGGRCAEAMPVGDFMPDFLRSRQGPTVDIDASAPLRNSR